MPYEPAHAPPRSDLQAIDLADVLCKAPETSGTRRAQVWQDAGSSPRHYVTRSIRDGVQFFGCDMVSDQNITVASSMPASLWIGVILEGSWHGIIDGQNLSIDADHCPKLLGFGENVECFDCHRAGRRVKMASFHIEAGFFDTMPGACGSFGQLQRMMVPDRRGPMSLGSIGLAAALAELVSSPFHGALEELHFESVSMTAIVEAARTAEGSALLQKNGRNETTGVPALAFAARQEIDAALDAFDSVEGLARRLGTNETSLRRQFKAAFGTTINGYVLSQRMQAARLMVRETDLQIAQISYRVGYKDPANFATAYRRHFGHPPSRDRSC